MKPLRKVYTMVATDANGIATSQTPTGAGNLTIDGALASGGSVTLSVGQHVTISSTGIDTARTFTVSGEDNLGVQITESITGPSISTSVGTKNFKKITQISVDDATAGSITAGIQGTAEFDWIPLDHYISPFEYAYYVNIGTATYQVESTLDDVQDSTITPVVNATVKASASADGGGASTAPAVAIRVKVTAFTSGDITLNLLQSGR